MHWHSAYVTALAWGIFSSAPSSSAFVLQRQRHPSNQQRNIVVAAPFLGTVTTKTSTLTLKMVGQMGWDNENFLESLGKGADAIQAANEEYRSQSRYRPSPDDEDDDSGRAVIEPEKVAPSGNPDELPTVDAEGAVLTEEMKEQMKRAHENPLEEGSQGGKLFRELLARAQGGGGGGGGVAAVPPPPPSAPSSPASYYPPPQAAAAAAYPGTTPPPPQPPLTIEQQAELYRQMVLQQAQASARTGSFVPPPPPPVMGGGAMMTPTQAAAAANRRVGRNRDADAIVNTSDVYFAQLKLDSSVRNIARYTGDEEAANKPFADPAIQEIKMHVNPYLSEAREKEQLLYETAAEERLELALADAAARQQNVPKDFAGIKYKEKLQQRRKQQLQQGNPVPPEATTAPPTNTVTTGAAAAPAVEAPKPTAPAPVPALAEPQTPASAPAATITGAPKQMTPPPPPPRPVQQAPPPPVAAATTTATSSPVKNDESNVKSDIRTLMGLLLKHRGGPGFGSGRLQGPDVDRFEQIAEQVLSVIQGETPLERSTPLKIFEATESAPVTPPAAATSSAISMKPTAAKTSIENMIAYIEGAIVMYKNSPPMLQDSVLATLRAAFVSAVGTLTDLLPGTVSTADLSAQVASGANTPTAERVQSIFLCIEGAIQMYKNSPPMLQESVLGSLRAALLTGVGTLNAIMATDSGMAASVAPSYLDVIPERSTSPPPPPPSAVATAPVAASSTPSVAAPPQQDTYLYSGKDMNSQFFEQVYSKLEAAAGDGKMGLKKDMSAEEAAELADSLAQMRLLLVDELQNGIPEEGDGPSIKGTETADSTASNSKYQDMLAKARANKDNNK